jgi:hypothetical protein
VRASADYEISQVAEQVVDHGQKCSAVEGLQYGLGVAFGDTEESAGGTFGMAVALFPILQSPRADADESGELGLTETEFFPNRAGIGPLERRGAGRFLFPAQDGATFLKAGGELLEEFFVHGYSVSIQLIIRHEFGDLTGEI